MILLAMAYAVSKQNFVIIDNYGDGASSFHILDSSG